MFSAEMRARALAAASAIAAAAGGCGNAVVDPATARCDRPQVNAGPRVTLPDHVEVPLGYRCADTALRGTLYLPKSPGAHPALVWVHAAGEATRLRWGGFTRSFVKDGFGFYSFDKRGVGQSQGDCCPADKGHFNLATADVVGAVAALRARSEIDRGRIGLIGASQAGWIAPHAAVESKKVGFVVLAAPGIVTFDQEHRYEQLTGGNGSTKPFPSEGEIAKALGKPSGFDVIPYLRRMNVPALWLLAGKDQEIPLTATTAALQRLKASGKDYTVKIYPGANHGLFDTPPTAPDALPDTLDWLRSHAD